MNKFLNYGFVTNLWKETQKCAGYVFALATTFVTFIPFDEILSYVNLDNIRTKLLFIITLCFISLLIAVCRLHNSENKSVVLFSKEKTSIKVEFGNMTRYIADNTSSTPYTVVIPINTQLYAVGDEKIIKENSMHGLWLKQMLNCGYDKVTINDLVCKQIKTNGKKQCKIGDYCYIKNIKNVNYLLVVTCDVSKEKKLVCSEAQYFAGLQNMVNALSTECILQEKIYIPIIGGGYANMRRTNQELLRQLTEVLIFNERKLQHEIHVVVYEQLRNEIQLFALKRDN